jgi:hypothetical protein
VTFCRLILSPVILVIRRFVQVIREVVTTVCEWVRGFVTTIKTIVERVCSWLPWPLDAICNLVTRTIEVIEEVWNWVCREVLQRIVDVVETILEYVIYILKWVCWVIAWPVRLIELIVCRLGFRPRLRLHICVRVLTARGRPAVSWAKVRRDFVEASRILDQCNIELVLIGAERVEKPEFTTGLACNVGGLFSPAWTWFSANECLACAAVTVYYVEDIDAKAGCSFPGSDWVIVDQSGDGATVAHEIGHLADLWAHSDDPNNLMFDSAGTTVTAGQCCMIRSSRYAVGAQRCPGATAAELPDEDDGPDPGETVEATAPPDTPQDHMALAPSRAFQAVLAAGAVGWIVRRLLRSRR